MTKIKRSYPPQFYVHLCPFLVYCHWLDLVMVHHNHDYHGTMSDVEKPQRPSTFTSLFRDKNVYDVICKLTYYSVYFVRCDL